MNSFDERYDIRFATEDEIPEIMAWVDEYWSHGHIFARDEAFFRYETVVDGRVNWVIARERATGEIHSVLGINPANHEEHPDIWDAIWRTREDAAAPMLGIELQKRLPELTGCRVKLSLGDRPSTSVRMFSRIFRAEIRQMKHYYALSHRDKYVVAKVEHDVVADVAAKEAFSDVIERSGTTTWRLLENISDTYEFYDYEAHKELIPYKDAWYVNRRFFEHPKYKYMVYGLRNDAESGLLICREQPCNGAVVLRIMDYYGTPSLFACLGDFMAEQLEKYEYIDMYFSGFDETAVRAAGLVECVDDDTNIIPEYFNPFEQKNLKIMCSTSHPEAVFFKADGDQDRPS